MAINRRRAPSRKKSQEKKREGHSNEAKYAELISGDTIAGTQKGDVRDSSGNQHSVKSGKKWQVFLYSQKRIAESKHLSVLKPCLDAFTKDYNQYVYGRTKCIELKEFLVKERGREYVAGMPNDEIKARLGPNEYIVAKERLAQATRNVARRLEYKPFLKDFLEEALFNGTEVSYLAVKDDALFRVFAREDVLSVLSANLMPANSRAGRVAEDYNVDGQKVLLRYTAGAKDKNIVEIEIRNDSKQHYREVRFNMYSNDFLVLLLGSKVASETRDHGLGVRLYGAAVSALG
jgi:hypothetical protein